MEYYRVIRHYSEQYIQDRKFLHQGTQLPLNKHGAPRPQTAEQFETLYRCEQSATRALMLSLIRNGDATYENVIDIVHEIHREYAQNLLVRDRD